MPENGINAMASRLRGLFGDTEAEIETATDRFRTQPEDALRRIGITVDRAVIDHFRALGPEEQMNIVKLFVRIAKYNTMGDVDRKKLLKDLKPVIEIFLQWENPEGDDRANW